MFSQAHKNLSEHGNGRPDREAAVEKYRRAVGGYDRRMRVVRRLQTVALDRLELRPGDVVIDVACGTGLNFQLVEDRIGADGHIIGIDLSHEMLAEARQRVESAGWQNVDLMETAVERAHIRRMADAALFSFTHDVLQSEKAVANVVRHLQLGARVSSVGAKLAPWWAFPVNLTVRRFARPFITTFEGLDRPWRELERYAGRMDSRSLALGGAYVAWGAITDRGSMARHG